MFTGIVHNQGTVLKKTKSGGQVKFSFKLKRKEKIKLGQSIAINGVCLTASKVTKAGFEADVMNATLEATTLGDLKLKDMVNLEKALTYGDEIGGHFVTGHVDAKGKITAIKKNKKNYTLTIKTPESMQAYLAPKGSITLDGISLTIQSVQKNHFNVGIIPHTWQETNLRKKSVSSEVNLEIDLIARYLEAIENAKKSPKKSKARLKKLIQQGF